MNPKVMARQARLLRMLESKEEIRIGRERDCPLPLAQLVKLKDSHPAVVKVYRHGLTAEVFHLKVGGITGASSGAVRIHWWPILMARPPF